MPRTETIIGILFPDHCQHHQVALKNTILASAVSARALATASAVSRGTKLQDYFSKIRGCCVSLMGIVLQCTGLTLPHGTGPQGSGVAKVLWNSVLLKQWLNCKCFCTLVHEVTFSQWSQYACKEKQLEGKALCDRSSETVW